jgi:hypothetical protein
MSDNKTTSNDNDLLSNPREHDHLGHYDQPTDCPKTSVSDDNYGQFEQPVVDVERIASQTIDEKQITTVDFDDIAPEPPFATLRFYADDPESMARLDRCLKSDKVLWAVQAFDEWLRGLIKYGAVGFQDPNNVKPEVVFELVRTSLHECFMDRGLDVWEE